MALRAAVIVAALIVTLTLAIRTRHWRRSVLPADREGTALLGDDPEDTICLSLSARVPRIDWTGVRFEDALKNLRAQTGAAIEANWEKMKAIGVDRDSPCTVRLQDVSLAKGLRSLILYVAGAALDYECVDGVIQVSTFDDLRSRVVCRDYPVQDLVMRLEAQQRQHPWPDDPLRLPTTSWYRWSGSEAYLSELVVESVVPAAWINQGTTHPRAFCFGGKLVVIAIPRDQTRVREVLRDLRKSTTIVISSPGSVWGPL
jgi:hypothetical protein